jgi:hypothetical protein
VDPKFNDVFEYLYLEYAPVRRGHSYYGWSPFRQVLQWGKQRQRRAMVQRAIAEGVERSEARERIRPDARLALLVNFDELVAKPLTLVRAAPSETLAAAIQGDTQLIVQAAAQVRPSGMITGGDIYRAVGLVYERMRSASFDLWG